MNILPKATKDFARKEYWDQFFKLQQDSFEWYGDYGQIKKILLQYIKLTDEILIVGCGNSSLSVDLYDDGYQQNTSIDISGVVIQKMASKYKCNGMRENLHFECMDVFNMAYGDGRFKSVIDKGTLDALSADESLDYGKMFSEIARVLKPLGRYVCITLLQENIVQNLLSWFTKSGCWIVRIHRCVIHNQTDRINFPVFIVVCTKLMSSISAKVSSLVEIDITGSGSFVKMQDISEACELIKTVQSMEFIKFSIRNNKIKDDNFHLELFDGTNEEYRYSLYFVHKSTITARRCAAFIVPQGREHEWLFSTAKGREDLLKQCQSDRLIVVILNRSHQYEDMDQIKTELSSMLEGFFPADNKKFTILSIGADIGERKEIFRGKSDFSGDFVVEDVVVDEQKYRRLVFLDNVNVIQSEAKLKTITTKKKKKTMEVIDHEYLSCSHHQTILASLALANQTDRQSYTLLLVGLGGGCFVNFILNNLKSKVKLKLTVVEIDSTMHSVAKRFFDFENHNLDSAIEVEVIIDDGLKFIEQSVRDKRQFDFIVFDVDSKNLNLGISCPPREFVEPKVLEQVHELIGESGLFILNLVARNEEIKAEIQRSVRQLFAVCLASQIEAELNQIIVCGNTDHLDWLQLKDSQQRNKFLKSSPFYIHLLSDTYNGFCLKKCLLLQ